MITSTVFCWDRSFRIKSKFFLHTYATDGLSKNYSVSLKLNKDSLKIFINRSKSSTFWRLIVVYGLLLQSQKLLTHYLDFLKVVRPIFLIDSECHFGLGTIVANVTLVFRKSNIFLSVYSAAPGGLISAMHASSGIIIDILSTRCLL